MEISESIELVRRYNRWRRGDDTLEMPNPSAIGESLDAICDQLDALAFAAARVEWKYGRTNDGKPKDWKEWNDLRECLGDRVRQPQELTAYNPLPPAQSHDEWLDNLARNEAVDPP